MEMERTRNSGLDMLKITAMLMILTVHYLGRGGYLQNTAENWGGGNAALSFLTWYLEAFCLVCVNCYVMVSGYFFVKSDTVKVGKIAWLLGQLWIINFGISLILLLFSQTSVSGISFYLHLLFPFVTKNNWFVNVYIGLYLLHPYLNKAINNMTKKEFQKLLCVMILLFTVSQTFLPSHWTLDNTKGYSVIWFTLLYLSAAYLRLYPVKMKSRMRCMFYYAGIAALLPVSRIVIHKLLLLIGKSQAAGLEKIWYQYNSFPVFLMSVLLFLIFLNSGQTMSGKWKRRAAAVSGLTFGVYLIQEQFALREILWTRLLGADRYVNSWCSLPILLVTVLLLFAAGIILSWSVTKILQLGIMVWKSLSRHIFS